MTLIVGGGNARGMWVLGDRRLTFVDGSTPDDAIKLLAVKATDGDILLAYAGLGLTALGHEPSAWMLRTLRGRLLSVEETMQTLANAAVEHLAPHLKWIRKHVVLAMAVRQEKARGYQFEVRTDAGGAVQFDGKVFDSDQVRGPPVWGFTGGSGGRSVHRAEWRSVLRANASGRLSDNAVARYLASVNLRAHRANVSVGPRCVVRNMSRGGGNQSWYFTETTRDTLNIEIPCIEHGQDKRAWAEILSRSASEVMEQVQQDIDAGVAPMDALKRSMEGSKERLLKDLDDYRALPKGPDPQLPSR